MILLLVCLASPETILSVYLNTRLGSVLELHERKLATNLRLGAYMAATVKHSLEEPLVAVSLQHRPSPRRVTVAPVDNFLAKQPSERPEKDWEDLRKEWTRALKELPIKHAGSCEKCATSGC